MLIDGAGSEITAAGQRHMGFPEASQQRAHQVIAGPHFPDELLIRLAALNLGTIDFHNTGLGGRDAGAHPLQNVQQNPDIGNIGYVLNPAFAADQQRCR